MTAKLTDLLGTFKAETESRFSFLVLNHNFSNESGFSSFSGPIPVLKKWDNESPPGLFWFVERYSIENMRFEIGFGDRELYVEGNWWFENPEQQFGMWEILEAAKRFDKRISGGAWVGSDELMKETLAGIAKSLEKNIDLFISPKPEHIDRALELRGKRLRYDQEKQRLRDLNRARSEAAEAFRSKKYQNVIRILEPYNEILTQADKKKVELSKKYAESI